MVYTTYEGAPPDGDPAQFVMTSSTVTSRYVVLERPHTILLKATVNGGLAVRGLYPGALARQIQKADGNIRIEDMHLGAIAEMRSKGYSQLPTCESLLILKLALPGKSRAVQTVNQVRLHYKARLSKDIC